MTGINHSVTTGEPNNPAYDVSATAWNADHAVANDSITPAMIQYPDASRTYLIWRDGATYYAKDGHTGTVTSNANFVTLITATIAACSAGNSIFIRAGTYVVGTTIAGKSGVSLYGEGEGALFDASTLAYNEEIISFSGSVAAGVNLASNGTKHDTHVHAVSATFAAGDLVMITSAAVWRSNPMGQLQGEFQILESAAANVLTFKATGGGLGAGGLLLDNYTTANTAKAVKVTPVSNVIVDGIKFLGIQGDTSSAGECLVGVQFIYGVNCKVTNCHFDSVTDMAIWVQSCYCCEFNDNFFYRSNMAGIGYGIGLLHCCQSCSASGNRGENCRHMIATGGSAALPGIPRGITMSNNQALDCYMDAFNTHETGEGIIIRGNTVTGGNSGMSYHAYSGIIDGNTIIGSYYGIYSMAANGDGMIISNNYICGTYSFGIVNEGTPTNTRHDVFDGNFILNTVNDQAVNILGSSHAIFVNNTMIGCPGTPTFTAGMTIKNNIGYVTENSGTATLLSGQTHVHVTHGCNYTPSLGHISIVWGENPSNLIADWWIDTIGATEFILNGVDPGASNLDFGWSVRNV